MDNSVNQVKGQSRFNNGHYVPITNQVEFTFTESVTRRRIKIVKEEREVSPYLYFVSPSKGGKKYLTSITSTLPVYTSLRQSKDLWCGERYR